MQAAKELSPVRAVHTPPHRTHALHVFTADRGTVCICGSAPAPAATCHGWAPLRVAAASAMMSAIIEYILAWGGPFKPNPRGGCAGPRNVRGWHKVDSGALLGTANDSRAPFACAVCVCRLRAPLLLCIRLCAVALAIPRTNAPAAEMSELAFEVDSDGWTGTWSRGGSELEFGCVSEFEVGCASGFEFERAAEFTSEVAPERSPGSGGAVPPTTVCGTVVGMVAHISQLETALDVEKFLADNLFSMEVGTVGKVLTCFKEERGNTDAVTKLVLGAFVAKLAS